MTSKPILECSKPILSSSKTILEEDNPHRECSKPNLTASKLILEEDKFSSYTNKFKETLLNLPNSNFTNEL